MNIHNSNSIVNAYLNKEPVYGDFDPTVQEPDLDDIVKKGLAYDIYRIKGYDPSEEEVESAFREYERRNSEEFFLNADNIFEQIKRNIQPF